VVGLVELYSYVDPLLADKLGLSVADTTSACNVNVTLSAHRPIALYNTATPERYLVCGWTAGPTGFRAFACMGALATAAVLLANLLKLKKVQVQHAASGLAAAFALAFLIAIVVDGSKLMAASEQDICISGHAPADPSTTYACTPGRFVAVAVLDTLLVLLLGAAAVISFFFVKSGHFALEVAEASVDYFGEAERYFPDAADDGKGGD
jgi:hypothetical protein